MTYHGEYKKSNPIKSQNIHIQKVDVSTGTHIIPSNSINLHTTVNNIKRNIIFAKKVYCFKNNSTHIIFTIIQKSASWHIGCWFGQCYVYSAPFKLARANFCIPWGFQSPTLLLVLLQKALCLLTTLYKFCQPSPLSSLLFFQYSARWPVYVFLQLFEFRFDH